MKQGIKETNKIKRLKAQCSRQRVNFLRLAAAQPACQTHALDWEKTRPTKEKTRNKGKNAANKTPVAYLYNAFACFCFLGRNGFVPVGRKSN